VYIGIFVHICPHKRRLQGTAQQRVDPRSPDLSFRFLCVDTNLLVYSAPIVSEEALHKRIFDACQTIHNRRRACERLQQSVIRRVYACGDLRGEHSERLLRILI
jgi:hypothetical protein